VGYIGTTGATGETKGVSENSTWPVDHPPHSGRFTQVIYPQEDSAKTASFQSVGRQNCPTEEDPRSTSETEQLEQAEADATYFASRPDSSLKSGGMLEAVRAHCQLVGKVSVADIREAFHVSPDEAVRYAREIKRSRKAVAGGCE